MRRIASMLDMSADKIRGLEDITVQKIDLFKDKNVLRLVLSGLPEEDNSLVAFSNEIKKQTDCDLKLLFTSSNRENIASYISNLNPYIIYLLSGSNRDLCYADKCRFEVDDEHKLKVSLDALFDMFVDDPVKRKIESSVLNFAETVLNVELEGSYTVLTEEAVSDNWSVNEVDWSEEADNIPTPPPPSEPYMPYIPPEIMAQAQEMTKKQEEQERKDAIKNPKYVSTKFSFI